MVQEQKFTPAPGIAALTPLYDTAISLLTRENTWRGELIDQLAPVTEDRILDVGCGTGSLAIRIKKTAKECEVHGIDPDEAVLQRAAGKAKRADVEIYCHHGFLTADTSSELGSFSKVVSSLVFHQTTIENKRAILTRIKTLLRPNGRLFIADYGMQRTPIMRALFRITVQALDGVKDTQHNADGCMPLLLKETGFSQVEETIVIPTLTG